MTRTAGCVGLTGNAGLLVVEPDYLKVLYYDGTGLCLFAKRLESGKFVWPPIVDGKMVLTPAQLTLLIEAMDWRRTSPRTCHEDRIHPPNAVACRNATVRVRRLAMPATFCDLRGAL